MQGQQRSLFPSSLTRQCWLASKFSLSLRALAPDSAPLSQVTASKVLGISSVCAPGNPLALPKAFCEGSLAGFSPQQCIHLLFGTLTTVFNAFGVGLGRVGRLSTCPLLDIGNGIRRGLKPALPSLPPLTQFISGTVSLR